MKQTPSPEAVVRACAGGLLLLSCALLLFVRESYGRVDGVETLSINAWHGPLCLTALASGVVLTACALRAKRRGERWAGWLLLGLGLGSPLLCCAGAFGEMISFHDGGSVRDEDGVEYHLLEMAVLQGSQLDLVRLRRRFGPLEEYEVLAKSPWEDGFLCLVRPQGAKEATLYLTSDRMLVGVPYKNVAFLAYDLDAGNAYGQLSNDDTKDCFDMRRLSPFLLLGKGDLPRESEFQTLLDHGSYGRPFPEALDQDVESENPRVRELARRLLADLRAHPVER